MKASMLLISAVVLVSWQLVAAAQTAGDKADVQNIITRAQQEARMARDRDRVNDLVRNQAADMAETRAAKRRAADELKSARDRVIDAFMALSREEQKVCLREIEHRLLRTQAEKSKVKRK